jgi:predicted  nucleic acid-binding Zn-ribbon protein
MSDEIQQRVDKLVGVLNQLVKDTASLSSQSNDLRAKEADRINNAVEKCLRDHKMISLETKQLPPEEKVKWNGELKGILKQIKEIQSELKWARTGDAAASAQGGPAATELGVISHGNNLMSKIDESTNNTLVMINEAEGIGTKTAAQLAAQGEQLQHISDNLYEIEDTLQRATAITKRMARRLLTDKYVWVLTVLIILAIIGIIALKVTKGVQFEANTGNA